MGKRVEMVSFRTIPARDFIREAESCLAENVPAATMAALRSRIDQLHAAYEDLKPGNHYALMYIPESGTNLELNGTTKVTIEGADFAAAYFEIWLGRRPMHKILKQQLMGNE